MKNDDVENNETTMTSKSRGKTTSKATRETTKSDDFGSDEKTTSKVTKNDDVESGKKTAMSKALKKRRRRKRPKIDDIESHGKTMTPKATKDKDVEIEEKKCTFVCLFIGV